METARDTDLDVTQNLKEELYPLCDRIGIEWVGDDWNGGELDPDPGGLAEDWVLLPCPCTFCSLVSCPNPSYS